MSKAAGRPHLGQGISLLAICLIDLRGGLLSWASVLVAGAELLPTACSNRLESSRPMGSDGGPLSSHGVAWIANDFTPHLGLAIATLKK